ncbi:MAG: flagellar basal body P-ring formation chaperone FlgA [Gemmobacter sp.]
MRRPLFPVLAALVGLTGPAMADPAQKAAVLAALAAAGMEAAGLALPARPLPPCDGTLTAAPRGDKAEILCAEPPWRRTIRLLQAPQVPAAPQGASAREDAPLAVVSLQPLARGSVIGPQDIGLAPVSDRSGADRFTRPEALIGRRLRQSLGEGQPILARNLEENWAVRAGRPARLRLVAGAVTVELQVEPMEDGTEGQTIRARHPVSGRILRARVTGEDFLTAGANTG